MDVDVVESGIGVLLNRVHVLGCIRATGQHSRYVVFTDEFCDILEGGRCREFLIQLSRIRCDRPLVVSAFPSRAV